MKSERLGVERREEAERAEEGESSMSMGAWSVRMVRLLSWGWGMRNEEWGLCARGKVVVLGCVKQGKEGEVGRRGICLRGLKWDCGMCRKKKVDRIFLKLKKW